MTPSYSSSQPIEQPQFFQLDPEGIKIFQDTARNMKVSGVAENALGKGQAVRVGINDKEVTFFKKDDFTRVKEEATTKIKEFEKSLNSLIGIWNKCLSTKPDAKEIATLNKELEACFQNMQENAVVVLQNQVDQANHLFEAIGHKLNEGDAKSTIQSIYKPPFRDEEMPPSPSSEASDTSFSLSVDESFPKFEHELSTTSSRWETPEPPPPPSLKESVTKALDEEVENVASNAILTILDDKLEEVNHLTTFAEEPLSKEMLEEFSTRRSQIQEDLKYLPELKKQNLTSAEVKKLAQFEKEAQALLKLQLY